MCMFTLEEQNCLNLDAMVGAMDTSQLTSSTLACSQSLLPAKSEKPSEVKKRQPTISLTELLGQIERDGNTLAQRLTVDFQLQDARFYL